MGDFNLDLLRHEQLAITGEFVELMFSHLLYPMTTKFTRITSNITSLINNMFTNNVTCLFVNGLIVNDLSDHFTKNFLRIKVSLSKRLIKLLKIS